MASPWVRVVAVRPEKDLIVTVEFADGTVRTVDLAPLMWGPVFVEIRSNRAMFEQVFVDEELGTIAWPNGADIAPEALYDRDPVTAAS